MLHQFLQFVEDGPESFIDAISSHRRVPEAVRDFWMTQCRHAY
jgi:hypothetical protein